MGLTLGFVWWLNVARYDLLEGDYSNSPASMDVGSAGDVELTIVYDNNPYDPRLKAAWGFACYVNTGEAGILFDTGGDPNILFDNMEKLNIDVAEIQIIVISHIHGDHVGGLFKILEKNNCVDVYVPASFPRDFKSKVKEFGCKLVEVHEPVKICEGVLSTGELGSGIREQSLIINSSEELIVVTGCAHPGIVTVVEKAVELTGGDVYLVIGGFHLGGSSRQEIEGIVERFESLNVEKVAPCHCSGDLARRIFKDFFNSNYIESGVGRSVTIKMPPADCQKMGSVKWQCRIQMYAEPSLVGCTGVQNANLTMDTNR